MPDLERKEDKTKSELTVLYDIEGIQGAIIRIGIAKVRVHVWFILTS
jgi:hypothetical protein